MTGDMKLGYTHSKESEIDRTVEDLIGKMIYDGLTPAEEALYNQLIFQRSRLMRPAVLDRQRAAVA